MDMASPSVPPEILKPIGRHFGVSHRVHDVFVAHVMLEGSSIVPIVGELIPSGVPKHVRVDRERQLSSLSGPSDHFQETRRRGRTAALGNENIPRDRLLPAELAQRPDFLAAQRMDIIDPALGSSDVQPAAVELNLIPSQVAHFRGAQPMSVGNQDHGRITVPIAGPLARSVLEPIDLLFGQIFPRSELGIRGPPRNCPVYDG